MSNCGCTPPPASKCPPPPESKCPPPAAKKCCEIPVLPACPPKDECDKNKNKCPPMPTTDCSACKPIWISCSPDFSKTYPVPDGVTIQPISVGGRNSNQGGACGKCGQEKSSGKPKVSANCPMMRPKCPGLETEKKEGLFAKLASLFGKDQENDTAPSAVTLSDAGRLESVCKSLNVEDEKIRHHRNVFNPELVVRRDGYMCPLLKKVEGVAAEAVAKFSQNFQVQCAGSNDKKCASPPPPPEEVKCASPPPPPPPAPEPEPETVPDCVEEEEIQEIIEEDDNCLDYEEDEECVEDVEGECIIDNEEEEVAPPVVEAEVTPAPTTPEPECTDNCNIAKLNKDNSCCAKQDCSCVPMSNFIIRVQAPFSEGTAETCETIVEKLCRSRGAMYPEPPPPAQDQCQDQPPPSSESAEDCNNNLKVIEIKEEPITFVCASPPKPTQPPKPTPPPQVVSEALPPPLTPSSSCACSIKTTDPKVTDTAAPKPDTAPPPPTPTVPKCGPETKSPEESRKLPPPPCPTFATPERECPQNCRLVDPPEISPIENKCTNTCIKCGQLKCDCNQDLKEHLKDCAGLGILPEVSPLLKKCEEIPPPPPQAKKPSAPSKEENKSPNSNDLWEYEAKPLCWEKEKPGPCGPSCNNTCNPSETQDLPETQEAPQVEIDLPPQQVDFEATPCPSETEETPPPQEQEQPIPENDLPAPSETPCPSPPPPEPQPNESCNSCSAPMTATEMCRANIASLMCGCGSPSNYNEDSQGRKQPKVWTSPPPPPCTYCGAATRGDNEDCAMCTFTRRARDPYRYDWVCPTVIEYTPPENPCFTKKDERPKCDSDEFDMTPQGTPIYEGGMCITRANYFLWKTNPCENSLKQMGFDNQCYDGFRRCAKCAEEGVEEEECVCLPKYKGGMSIDEFTDFIWERTTLETAPKTKSNKMFKF